MGYCMKRLFCRYCCSTYSFHWDYYKSTLLLAEHQNIKQIIIICVGGWLVFNGIILRVSSEPSSLGRSNVKRVFKIILRRRNHIVNMSTGSCDIHIKKKVNSIIFLFFVYFLLFQEMWKTVPNVFHSISSSLWNGDIGFFAVYCHNFHPESISAFVLEQPPWIR